MGITKTVTINWAPFSESQVAYMKQTISNYFNVLEGPIRTGKTIIHCLVAKHFLETCPDKIHLASGSTIGNAKLNIGDCNGFGLEHLFRGRCRWGKYKQNECLRIRTKNGEKIVIFAGGGKADSYKKILGNSYGLWIATEINEHYDCDDSRSSFIKVALGRQLAAQKRLVLWDLNPCDPHNKIYSDYIDKYLNEGLLGGYNYHHTTMEENLSLTDERKQEIASQYDPNSLWYKRDILGLRVTAEGLIYNEFANNNERYIIPQKQLLNDMRKDIAYIRLGVDFGNNKSPHSFTATAVGYQYKFVIPFEEEIIKGSEGLTPEQLNERFIMFVKKIRSQIGYSFLCRCDSAETTLIRGFQAALIRNGIGYCEVRGAIKKPILERIRLVNSLISQGRFFITDNMSELRMALNGAIWSLKNPDEREDITGDNNPVDRLDSLEYSIEEDIKNIMLGGAI